MFKETFTILIAGILLLSLVPVASAAPSGTIYDPVGTVADNVLELGGSERVAINFTNTAGADITDVASTIQYVHLAAANLNPSRTVIPPPYAAHWEIYAPPYTAYRASGDVSPGSLDTAAIYAPYSTTQTVYMYSWSLGKPGGPSNLDNYTSSAQFDDSLKILRPGEILELNVTMQCQNVVGDDRFWFFFKATEDAFASGSYPTAISQISDKSNLYYSKLPGPIQTKHWLPLHNSYDPYDSDIDTGHNFDQLSWTRGATTTAFAKGNKLVHQKPVETPTPCIHIVKYGPGSAQVGQTITYKYNVTNCGNEALSGVKTGVTDTLGMTVNYVSGDTNGDNLLDTTETWYFTATYTVKVTDPNPLNNTATASGTGDTSGAPVTDSSDFSVPITPEPPTACINIVKDGPGSAQVGQTITYEYIVTNCGTQALSSVTVTDDVAGTATYVGGDTNGDNLLDTTETWYFTATYTVKVTDPNPLNNTATASGSPPTGPSVTDSSDFSVPITIVPPITVFSFHICGAKFDDLNRNGVYDVETELGIGLYLDNEWKEAGVTVTLLGPDKTTKATVYYLELSYPDPEDATPDVLETGENGLKGSYCFNLVAGLAASGKTYIFYVKIEEPPGKGATTPILIGPITFVASVTGLREDVNNNFGNAVPRPVGGYLTSVSKLAVLTPYLALVGLVGVASTVFAIRRRHKP